MLSHLQQKDVCPKVWGGQSSDLLENPLGLLTSRMKCESWVIHRLGRGSRSILKKRGFFSLPLPCCDYVTSREFVEVLSVTLPVSLSFSRDGEHQLQGWGASAADLHVRSRPVKAEGDKAFWPPCSSPGQQLLPLEVGKQRGRVATCSPPPPTGVKSRHLSLYWKR